MTAKKTYQEKIGLIMPGHFIPPTDGGQRVCYDLCLALAKKTQVVCFSAHRGKLLPNVEFVQLFSRLRFTYTNIRLVWRLAHQLRQHKLQFCIVNQPYFFYIAFLASRVSGCKLITYAHNLEFRRNDGSRRYLRPLIFLLELGAFHLSYKVFFISQQELDDGQRLFRLPEGKCVLVPHIARKTDIDSQSKEQEIHLFTIIFFGNFSYPPNLQALNGMLDHFVPILAQLLNFQCRLLIFGKSIPANLSNQQVGKNLSVELLGYLDNPLDYIVRADVMINPVCQGAGVQTKIIEALAAGTTVVSARSGARGIDEKLAPEKLLLVEDDDWIDFAEQICHLRANGSTRLATPDAFFYEYSEYKILDRIAAALASDIK